ncbi:MAG: FtsX-like permease family protein [Verrucomicrobia bacterium]|nr:FtsX-like permease family protein [Verrucomicrobiota bacterium]
MAKFDFTDRSEDVSKFALKARLTGQAFSWARLKRTVRLGLKSLWLHKLRSLLTVLGIVFGVCSVIAMLAIGEGASFEAQEQIKNLGSQNIILRSIKPPEEQKVSQANQSFTLEYGLNYLDLKAIQSTIPGVTVIVPGRVIRDYVWNIARRVDCEILGTVPWYPTMRNHRVAQGRFFSDYDMEEKASVCVLGAEMADRLFPLSSPLGETVRVGERYYRVIGVMEPAAKSAKNGDANLSAAATPSALHRMYIPLGAKRRDIIIQFLVETVMLSGAGGVMGVILGVSIPYIVTWFSQMVTIVTLWAPMIAFSISALVGVVFGLYPAFRAASMDPVEALRHE